jgi:hypothetical protein
MNGEPGYHVEVTSVLGVKRQAVFQRGRSDDGVRDLKAMTERDGRG